ncbi:MAG: hydantoinase B/oxoprolinase family protein, partial [Gemmatimonadota bacterium]|nr:hydantoinase B/oxoprolinase family protein [Gemmatimonadota bacterium]
LGLEREWTLLAGETHLAIRSDRRKHLPYGLYGGGEGAGSINVLHDRDGERRLPVMISTTMKEGQVLYHRQAGAGGWGDPLDRAPEAVARDVRNDKVGLQAARGQYGVVLDEETMEVDQEATAALRRRHRMQGEG